MSRLGDLLSELPRLEVPRKPLHEFTCFPRLPIELRDKIWAYAAYEPRKIKLFDGPMFLTRYVRNQPKVPGLLHACQQARKEGLNHYQLCLERTPFDSSHMNQIYVNFEVDRFMHLPTMWEDPADAEGYNFDTSVLEQIKVMEVHGTTRPIPISWLITFCFELEELALVVPAPDGIGITLELSRSDIEDNIVADWNNQGFTVPGVPLVVKFKQARDDWDAVPCTSDGIVGKEEYFEEVEYISGWEDPSGWQELWPMFLLSHWPFEFDSNESQPDEDRAEWDTFSN